MAIMTSGDIPQLLIKAAHTIFGDYNTHDDLWKWVYKTQNSERGFEYDVEMRGMGPAGSKTEAGPVDVGSMGQGPITTYTPKWYGKAFQVTRQAIEDNLYENQFSDFAFQLKTALRATRNYNAMYLFNSAFTNAARVSDGQPLCSTQHPIANGTTLQNTFSNPVGFNEATLEAAITTIKQWRNLAGIKIDVKPKTLFLPVELEFQAARLLNSSLRTGTANNDINALKDSGIFSNGYKSNVYLTNPFNWFIVTDIDNGFKHIHRTGANIRHNVEILTDVTVIRINERYCFGTSNWRCVFGAQGSSAS